MFASINFHRFDKIVRNLYVASYSLTHLRSIVYFLIDASRGERGVCCAIALLRGNLIIPQ